MSSDALAPVTVLAPEGPERDHSREAGDRQHRDPAAVRAESERARTAGLEQRIEDLARQLRHKETAIKALSEELKETRAWVRELQSRLVKASTPRARLR